MGDNGEAAARNYKKLYFTASHVRIHIRYCKSHENTYQYYKSRKNPYQILQVMRTASDRAMKSKVCMKNYHHSTKLYRTKYHEFVAVCIVMTAQHE